MNQMAKSQIIRDLADDNVPLEKSLNRLFVLASDVSNEQLAQWAEKELNGYKANDELPEYRKTKGLHLTYTGINGNFQVTNVPLQLDWLGSNYKDLISEIKMYDGIRFINDLSSSEENPKRDLSGLAGEISRITNGVVQCVSVYQVIPKAFLQSICSTVKSIMIVALLDLEKKYGTLDSLGIEISERQKVQLETNNAELNRSIFNINLPSLEKKKEPWFSKVGWNIIIPIITGIIGVVIGAMALKYLKL